MHRCCKYRYSEYVIHEYVTIDWNLRFCRIFQYQRSIWQQGWKKQHILKMFAHYISCRSKHIFHCYTIQPNTFPIQITSQLSQKNPAVCFHSSAKTRRQIQVVPEYFLYFLLCVYVLSMGVCMLCMCVKCVCGLRLRFNVNVWWKCCMLSCMRPTVNVLACDN